MAITLDGTNGITTNNGKAEIRNSDYSNGLLLNRNLDVASVGTAGVQMKYGAIYNGSDVYPVITQGVVETDGTAGWWEVTHDGSSKLKVDSAGRVTMPYQPAFAASGTSAWHLISTGDPVILNAEFFDTGGHYNASIGRFTAPVAGRYCFQVNVYVDVQSYTPRPCLTVNGSQIATSGDVVPYAYNSVSSPEGSMGFSYTMQLSAGDYVQLEQRTGYDTMRIYYPHSHFSGYLIG